MKTFTGNFTQQEGIPDSAINKAIEVMRSGRLHRYNVADGEKLRLPNLSWSLHNTRVLHFAWPVPPVGTRCNWRYRV